MSQPRAHDELVFRAVRWLRNSFKCPVVLQEPVCMIRNQSPDAIGWTPRGWSIVVEAKMSCSDLMAELRKPYRRAGEPPMGQERWFLTPRGMIDPSRVPEGWGLAEVRGSRVIRVVRREWQWDPEVARHDAAMLVKAAREALDDRFSRTSIARAEMTLLSSEAAE